MNNSAAISNAQQKIELCNYLLGLPDGTAAERVRWMNIRWRASATLSKLVTTGTGQPGEISVERGPGREVDGHVEPKRSGVHA